VPGRGGQRDGFKELEVLRLMYLPVEDARDPARVCSSSSVSSGWSGEWDPEGGEERERWGVGRRWRGVREIPRSSSLRLVWSSGAVEEGSSVRLSLLWFVPEPEPELDGRSMLACIVKSTEKSSVQFSAIQNER
jgi:hypothetical protein